ncbi:MAG: dTDP-4-dehydrorhamnose reductase [Candidatus Edwardsbacteria bacterium]|nr:dTDP-4-dehydrorhamnose reductase [Candidatus Edwardsbacteria bacterium]MBU1577564.1 dTDP-4-dehydrorhamnose reductase [Candidatus Edwardsbacteria bacterium]MBU2462594.1 dTDP-4-dehydrorhamnose reductase [Candidatus Edwardsbacteria bacterium]MBU2593659.1 dTDP-4-dehydrorhamnose reductase [Candidatus Edwardsbacteria bacterium]
MKILVTGAKGMLGTDLCLELAGDHQVTGIDIQDIDITSEEAIKKIIGYHPEFIIHCAAMTNVDGCEKDPDTAYAVNGLGTKNVVLACRQLDIPVLYISTDFVFDGAKGEPYCEWDQPNPLGHYGRSKLEGENHVRELLKKFYIVRTSWLYGKQGRNFVSTILAKARETGTIKVVNDQVGSPTYARDLCRAIARLISSNKYGTYHLSNSGACSWFDFAKRAVELSGTKAEVLSISSSDYPTPTKRPAFSVLRNFCWERTFGETLRPWEEGLKDYLKETGYIK